MSLPATIKERIKRTLRALPVRERSSAGSARRYGPSFAWRLARFLIAGSRDHAFLDRGLIRHLFALVPAGRRRDLALRLLSLSPHYWVYQWTDRYPPQLDRREVLEREFSRNARSRREIADKLLSQFLKPQTNVLDFGCGPGFLARAASRLVGRVTATDVSRGVLECARVLNPAPNLAYVRNRSTDLAEIASGSMDLIYSFAVFQHLRKDQAAGFFREFFRVLRPGGEIVCHTILKEETDATRLPDPSAGGWVRRRVMLRMVYYTPAEMVAMLRQTGFADVRVAPIEQLAAIDDDVGREQLVLCRKPG